MSNGHEVVRTFHTTAIVPDYDAVVAALGKLADLRVFEYSESQNIGRRGGMTWLGDNSIEIGEPIVPGHASERFVERFGGGMHSYAFEVTNLDATLEHFAASGVTVGVRPSNDFCFTDPRTTGGLLFEWAVIHQPEDPRFGAPMPAASYEPILDVRQHAFAGAVVPDPVQWADTFGQLFGLTETFRNPNAAVGEPVVGLTTPDCTIALYRVPGDASESEALWGDNHFRARFHVLGLGVPSLDDAAKQLATAGVSIIRRTDDAIVLDPAAGATVGVVLVEDLLTGDPRR